MNRALVIGLVVAAIVIVVVGITLAFTVFRTDLNKLIGNSSANISKTMGLIELFDAQYGTVIGTNNVLYIDQVVRVKIQFPTSEWKAYLNAADTTSLGTFIVKSSKNEFLYTITEKDSMYSSVYFYVEDSTNRSISSKSNRYIVKPMLEIVSAPGLRDSLNSIRIGTPVEFQLNVQPISWLEHIEIRSYNYDYNTKVVSTQSEILTTSYANGAVVWNAPEHYIDQYYIFEITFNDKIRKNRFIDDVFVRTVSPILVESEIDVSSTDITVSTGSIQSAQMMDRTGLSPHTMFVNDILRVRFRFNAPVPYMDVEYRLDSETDFTKLIQGTPVINDEITFFVPPLDYGSVVVFKCIDTSNAGSSVVLRSIIVDSYWELTFDKEDGFTSEFFASSKSVWSMLFPVNIYGYTDQYKERSRWGFQIRMSDGVEFKEIPGFDPSTVAISLVNYGSSVNSYAIRLDFTALLSLESTVKLTFEFSFDGGIWLKSPEVYTVKLLSDTTTYAAGESLSGIAGLESTVRCGSKVLLSYIGSHYGTDKYPAPVNWLLNIPTDEDESAPSNSIFDFSKPGYRTILIGQTQGENRTITFVPPNTYSSVDCQIIVYLVDNPRVYFKSNFFSILPSLFILEDSTSTPVTLSLTPQSNVVWYISGPGAEALTDGIDLFEFWYKSVAGEWTKLSGTNSLSALTPSKQVKLTWYFNPPSAFKSGNIKVVSKIITKEEIILNKTINVISASRTEPSSYSYFDTLRYKSIFSDHFVPGEVIELNYSSGQQGKIYNVYDITDYDNPVLVKLCDTKNRSKEFIKIPANKKTVRYAVGLNVSTMIAEMVKSVSVYHVYGYKDNTNSVVNKSGDIVKLSFYLFSSDLNADPYWSFSFDDDSKFNLKSRKKESTQDSKFSYIKYVVELPNYTFGSEKRTYNITAKNLTNSLSFAIVV